MAEVTREPAGGDGSTAGQPGRARTVRILGIGFVVVAVIVAIVAAVVSGGDDTGSGRSSTTTTGPRPQVTLEMSLKEVMTADPKWATLLAYLESSKVIDEFSTEKPLTIFAPSAEALGALDGDVKDDFTDDPTGDLAEVLRRHVVPGRLRVGDLIALDGKTVTNLAGEELPVAVVDGVLTVGGTPLAISDIDAADAEIHQIATVLSAPSDDAPPATETETDAEGDGG